MNHIHSYLFSFLCLFCGVYSLSACEDEKLMAAQDTPAESGQTRNSQDESYVEGVAAPYSDAIYPMDYVPREETRQEVLERDTRVRKRISDFWINLNAAITGNTLNAWIDNFTKIATKERSPYLDLTYLCVDYNCPQLKKLLVTKIKDDIKVQYKILLQEIEIDKKNGQSGSLRDLNTTQPAGIIMEDAYCLKRLGAYKGEIKLFIESVIDTHVEGKANYYKGDYLSTGYNKELFALNVAFWVKMLYSDDSTKYPLCKTSFNTVYNALLNYSYDADNSPHYDANTGFNLLLHWGLLLNDEAGLKNSIHIKRIMDRMSRTIMNSGQTAGWGKLMGGVYEGGREYLLDAGIGMTWCLKVGYRLFKDPYYLYMARKYEDFRFNVGCTQWNNDYIDLYPIDINRKDTDADVPAQQTSSLLTPRITSKSKYDGLLLGRGDRDYKQVQDKLILSTGHHPRAPYMLMDLSYTQHKAAPDHRIGIDNFIFNGTHVCTYLGRPAEGFRINRPFIAPKSLSENFPIFNIPEAEVEPNASYYSRLGFDSRFDYVIGNYAVKQLSEDVAYGEVEYTRFQYEGISAKRKMLLLNNGVLIVYDKVVSAAGNNRKDVVGVLYNVWPSVAKTGKNWLLQGVHKSSMVKLDSRYDFTGQTLFYFPRTKNNNTMSVKTDPLRNNKSISSVLCSQTELNSGEDAEFITLIIPMRKPDEVETFVSGISVAKEGSVYTVSIPSPSGTAIVAILSPTEASVTTGI